MNPVLYAFSGGLTIGVFLSSVFYAVGYVISLLIGIMRGTTKYV